MKSLYRFIAVACTAVCATAPAFPADVVVTAPAGGGATVVYRQVMPDGRVVYSDKAEKGAKIDHTITIEPPIKGNLWTTESGTKPVIPEQIERTPVQQVGVMPTPGKKKTAEEANSDVIRAEMLLEDAKKRQEAGVEPLPGERSGISSGGSRLNEAYEARQKLLAREVVYAEAALKKAIADRDALRHGGR